MLAKAQLSRRCNCYSRCSGGAVVVGTPAKVIKQTSEVEDSKREIVSTLRKLND